MEWESGAALRCCLNVRAGAEFSVEHSGGGPRRSGRGVNLLSGPNERASGLHQVKLDLRPGTLTLASDFNPATGSMALQLQYNGAHIYTLACGVQPAMPASSIGLPDGRFVHLFFAEVRSGAPDRSYFGSNQSKAEPGRSGACRPGTQPPVCHLPFVRTQPWHRSAGAVLKIFLAAMSWMAVGALFAPKAWRSRGGRCAVIRLRSLKWSRTRSPVRSPSTSQDGLRSSARLTGFRDRQKRDHSPSVLKMDQTRRAAGRINCSYPAPDLVTSRHQ